MAFAVGSHRPAVKRSASCTARGPSASKGRSCNRIRADHSGSSSAERRSVVHEGDFDIRLALQDQGALHPITRLRVIISQFRQAADVDLLQLRG
jgi:hypothetical protein